MQYDPNIHNRQSIRLKGYDYSKGGAYFVTLRTHNRAYLFGKIKKGKMILNDPGNMISTWWHKLPEKFENVQLDAFIVMPDHFHGIIIIVPVVGADPCVCPDTNADNITSINQNQNKRRIKLRNKSINSPGEHTGSIKNGGDENPGPDVNDRQKSITQRTNYSGEHTGSPLRNPATLSQMVQWFKSMTTNEYIRHVKHDNWLPFKKKLWQRNYYEHIIRDTNEFKHIRKYIIENPLKWHINNHMLGRTYVSAPYTEIHHLPKQSVVLPIQHIETHI